jgi:hypothetical protein
VILCKIFNYFVHEILPLCHHVGTQKVSDFGAFKILACQVWWRTLVIPDSQETEARELQFEPAREKVSAKPYLKNNPKK